MEAENDQSFEMSVSLNEQEQHDSSLGMDSLGNNSLREFRYFEHAAKVQQRLSMELPRA